MRLGSAILLYDVIDVLDLLLAREVPFLEGLHSLVDCVTAGRESPVEGSMVLFGVLSLLQWRSYLSQEQADQKVLLEARPPLEAVLDVLERKASCIEDKSESLAEKVVLRACAEVLRRHLEDNVLRIAALCEDVKQFSMVFIFSLQEKTNQVVEAAELG